MKTLIYMVIVLAAAAGAAPAGAVSLYRGGNERRGGEGTIPSAVATVWNRRTKGAVTSSPFVAGGRLYAATSEGYLYCLDPATGSELWRFEARYARTAPPAVARGLVVLPASRLELKRDRGRTTADTAGMLSGIDAASGKELWKRRFPDRIFTAAAIGEGRVYVGREGGTLCCLDGKSGRKLWDFRCGGAIVSSPALRGGRIIFGGIDGRLHCLSAAGGKAVWKTDLDGPVWAAPAVEGKTVFIGTRKGAMHALDSGTGKTLWKKKTGKDFRYAAAVEGGMLYAGAADGSVFCWDAATGARIWRTRIAEPCAGPVAAGGGKVLAAGRGGYLHCLDAGSGTEVWKVRPGGGGISTAASFFGDAVYMGTEGGVIWRLGPKEVRERAEKAPAPMSDGQFEEKLTRAEALVAAGRYGDAAVIAKEVSGSREDSVRARLVLARACEGMDELGAAGREYALAVQLEPENAACRGAMGAFYARLGRVREAMEEFRYAARLAPDDPASYANIGKLRLTRGETKEAEKNFRLALDRGSRDPAVFLCLAEIHIERLEHDKAIPFLKRCLAEDPENGRARELLRSIGGRE